jgi:hypothetical protein
VGPHQGEIGVADAFDSDAADGVVEETVLPRGGAGGAVGARQQLRREPGDVSPRAKPAQVAINKERLAHWLSKGARPSDSVRTLIAKHLTKDLTPQAPVAAAQ